MNLLHTLAPYLGGTADAICIALMIYMPFRTQRRRRRELPNTDALELHPDGVIVKRKRKEVAVWNSGN